MSDAGRIPLKEGLRLYWHHLLPIALLPVAFLSSTVFVSGRSAFWLMTPFFFGLSYYAGIPYLKKNVTYQFWILACGLWMAGFIIGIPISSVLRAIFNA